MDFLNNLKNILAAQKQELAHFEEELSSIEKIDILNDYHVLEEKSKICEADLASLKTEHAELEKKYHSIRDTLSLEIYNQKLNLLAFSKTRVFKLYKDFETDNFTALKDIELSAETQLAKINQSAADINLDVKNEVQAKIEDIKKFIYDHKQKQEEQACTFGKDFQHRYENEYAQLQAEPLSEEQIKKRTANTNIEMKLGKRITNIVGIVFVLIGVALALQYTFTNLITSNYVKSGAAFFLGLCFLVCGELLNRKSRSVFSLGITAGGIAILFTVTGISYFLLDLFSMPFAFTLTVLISAAAFLLSLRYASQIIAVFAYAGAVLPIFSAADNFPNADITLLLTYLFILNVFVLLLYTRKDWSILKYISFSFHIIAFLVLNYLGMSDVSCALLISFVALNYCVYIAIPLISALKNEKQISNGSSIILGINTLFSAGLVFLLLNINHYEDFFGLAALIMAAFFIGLGYVIYKTIKSKQLLVLFLGMAFIFAILIIPLQLDSKWISLGWLAEAMGLLIVGIMLENKWYKISGSIILALSILCFIGNDLFSFWHDAETIGKASAITIACLTVLFCGIWKHRNIKGYMHSFDGRFLLAFKNCVSIICFCYLVLLDWYFIFGQPYAEELFFIVLVYLCFAISFVHEFVRALKDRFGKIFQKVLIILGMLLVIILNTIPLLLPQMILLVFANALSVFCILIFTNSFAVRGKISREAQTIMLSVCALALMLQILMCQYDYSLRSMIISIVLVLASLSLVIGGFVKRFAYLRRFGLALNFISLIKFFLLDLSFLAKAEKIISYFILGFVLIGISFVYQFFSKKLFTEHEDDER